jgi:hypothetical protein
MSEKFEGLKKVANALGEANANRFLDAGWRLIGTETNGNFTKFNFGWFEEGDPQWPEGITRSKSSRCLLLIQLPPFFAAHLFTCA